MFADGIPTTTIRALQTNSIIHSNARALVDLGLRASGYHYVTVDCGWTLPNRTAEGTLTWNPALFPSGYPALGTFIHDLDLGFGVYSDGGIKMCVTGSPAQAGSLCMFCEISDDMS
jgi:alpha-galactosidase